MNRMTGGDGPRRREHRYIEELVGKRLYDFLCRAHEESEGLRIELDGVGVHWHVDCSRGIRRCRVHCFHHGNSPGDLHLGPHGNAHLRTVRAVSPAPKREGVEYLVCFQEAEADICEGRTGERDEVSACVELWLVQGSTRAQIYESFDFVDKNRRALRRLAEVIDQRQEKSGSDVRASLDQGLGGDVGIDLWVYGGERSCLVEPSKRDSSIGCAFLLHATQLAGAAFSTPEGSADAVHRWIDTGVSLAELKGLVDGLDVAPFAHEFERGGIATWHWSNVLARAEAERDTGEGGVLAYYLPVFQRVVSDPTMRRFFSFTSLNQLCFSRCSHYPFSIEGMPALAPAPEGYYAECGDETVRGDVDLVCDFVRRHLAAIDEEPWHGCISDSLIEPVNALLEEQRSSIRVRRVQRQQWFHVLARSEQRSCGLHISEDQPHPYRVYFSEDDERAARAQFRDLPGMVCGIRRWLEDAVSVENLAEIADKLEPEKSRSKAPNRESPDAGTV